MKKLTKHLGKTLLNITLSAMVVFTVSCSGEDGEDGIDGINGVDGINGIDGSDGSDGIDGIDGAIGEQGPAGQDGNANVISSDWFQVQYDDISSATPPTRGAMTLQNDDIPEVNLEEFVEDGGMALVYCKMYEGNDENEYYILPIPTTFNNISFLTGFTNFESQLSLVIQIEGSDVSQFENLPNITFRYVLIPATTAQDLNLNSGNIPKTFEEAAKLFRLDE